MSGPDWEYLYGELLQSTADQKGMIDYLEERRAALEAENERLHDLACADWFRCPVPQLNEANDALKEEVERLRAVVEAARWVTPYIPEVGEETYCHPMHHGYHNGQFHTVYVTTREQEQFGKWAENFVDALAALDEEVGE
jgi:uncharacterized small protein (DUF1192 family)